ncbi:hypothetical protein [Maridesulfovibrio bastinii]|uniref:hypothetical protein n=1 Tax=Maridesulfovibrio bastinii TaxID=47157 RepID=UPI00048A1486|nr:hypothetical protein [Maridesulfovibrio bastinii]
MITKKLIAIIFCLIVLPATTLAAPQVVTETHTYVLGDNDSKNDARTMCFLEAKRKMLEKAETLVMSHTQANMGRLTKDEINSYTAALIKIENAGEEWRFNDSGSMVVVMTVKAVLDYDDIKKRLNDIQKDSTARKKIVEQQDRLAALEKMIAGLQQKLGKANVVEANQLRKDRNVAFQEIDELQTKKNNNNETD